MELEKLYKEVILDHASNPRNKIDNRDTSLYNVKRGYNPSCGDDIKLFIKFHNDVIEEIYQTSTGCSISSASTSLITVSLKNKNIDEAKKKINSFLNMIKNIKYNKNDLSFEERAFEGVKLFPARVKCASLAWVTALEMVNEHEQNTK